MALLKSQNTQPYTPSVNQVQTLILFSSNETDMLNISGISFAYLLIAQSLEMFLISHGSQILELQIT